jgi:hypothetical protein
MPAACFQVATCRARTRSDTYRIRFARIEERVSIATDNAAVSIVLVSITPSLQSHSIPGNLSRYFRLPYIRNCLQTECMWCILVHYRHTRSIVLSWSDLQVLQVACSVQLIDTVCGPFVVFRPRCAVINPGNNPASALDYVRSVSGMVSGVVIGQERDVIVSVHRYASFPANSPRVLISGVSSSNGALQHRSSVSTVHPHSKHLRCFIQVSESASYRE